MILSLGILDGKLVTKWFSCFNSIVACFYRSNCNSHVASKIRQHYSRPYFLPKESEMSKTDWIFMGAVSHLQRNSIVMIFCINSRYTRLWS